MILDADGLLNYFDRSSPRYWAAAGTIESLAEVEELVVSPFVIAELETIVCEKFGIEGWLVVLDELAGGAWTIATIDAAHLAAVRDRVEAGETLAGASVAVLAGGAS